MFKHRKITGLEDFFIFLSLRNEKSIFFYRINGWNKKVEEFIKRYYKAAMQKGVVIEGGIKNPDKENLAYYDTVMGRYFMLDIDFISHSLTKWLPRINAAQKSNICQLLYGTLEKLKLEGKNEGMLKNAYIKFMCWLYYRFEMILNRLGEEEPPKILYEGDISRYELMFMSILSGAGCDIVLLQYGGDGSYLKTDPNSCISENLVIPDMEKFPENFNLKSIRESISEALNRNRMYGSPVMYLNCTNAWISGKGLEDIKTALNLRAKLLDEAQPGNRLNGQESNLQFRINDNTGTGTKTKPYKLFYNCFIRINGVEDKSVYANELYSFLNDIKSQNRNAAVIDNMVPLPSNEEIALIKRHNYTDIDQMLLDLQSNIEYTGDPELKKLIKKAFLDIMFEEAQDEKADERVKINRLTNKAVCLLCWIKRYLYGLFKNYRFPDVECFIHTGGCKSGAEAAFIRLLARLPVDVLILKPDLNSVCEVKDRLLYDINFEQSMELKAFPKGGSLAMGTAAYHAERELDTLLYQDSGIYREGQYKKASVIKLRTMYEEIAILWDEELKFRPNFSINSDTVNIPVIFAKVSGVKDGNIQGYWADIHRLITSDTIVIRHARYIDPNDRNPLKAHAAEFYKNGKLQKLKIKKHPAYKYGFLDEAVQDHILDKLQELIDKRIIKGTFENGMEYAAVALVLNLPMEILRMLQKFDFTKKNPKIIYINTAETIISLEDAILTAFLSLAGFDIIFFIPTGYRNIENHFNTLNDLFIEEHRIGTFLYDLDVSELNNFSQNTKTADNKPWYEKIFKKSRKR